MKLGILVVARMGSSRLPGKILKELSGETMLSFQHKRLQLIGGNPEFILCTTSNTEDDHLVSQALKIGYKVFRGSSEDVLGRIEGAVNQAGVDLVMVVLGDNPLVDHQIAERCIAEVIEKGVGYCAPLTREYSLNGSSEHKLFPIGIRVQVMLPELIHKVAKLAKTPDLREHATSLIQNFPEKFGAKLLQADDEIHTLNELNLSVNTAADLARLNLLLGFDPNIAHQSIYESSAAIRRFFDDEICSK
jgi:spore coat polysaccharide biosynthesis protein SpsF